MEKLRALRMDIYKAERLQTTPFKKRAIAARRKKDGSGNGNKRPIDESANRKKIKNPKKDYYVHNSGAKKKNECLAGKTAKK